MTFPRTRRAAIAAISATAVLVSGAVAISAVASPHHMSGAGSGSTTQSSVPHPRVSALRFATAKFHNLQVAQNNGYAFFTDAKGIAVPETREDYRRFGDEVFVPTEEPYGLIEASVRRS